jgi:hypothetical protein
MNASQETESSGGIVPTNTVRSGKSALTEAGFPLFETWKQYERVAMHFNDLLLKIRTQSLAAVATVATVAGVVLRSEGVTPHVRWGMLSALFGALTVFWIAIWILDFCYYNRLLLGAVDALLAVEKASTSGRRIGHLDLSTRIEATVRRSEPRSPADDRGGEKGRWAFYLLVFAVLAVATVVCIQRFGGPLELWRVLSTPAVRADVQPSQLNPQSTVPTLVAPRK